MTKLIEVFQTKELPAKTNSGLQRKATAHNNSLDKLKIIVMNYFKKVKKSMLLVIDNANDLI